MSKFDMAPGSTSGEPNIEPEKSFSPSHTPELPKLPENKVDNEPIKERKIDTTRFTLQSIMEQQARAIREDVKDLEKSNEKLISGMAQDLGLSPIEFEKKMDKLAWKRKTLSQKALAIVKNLSKRITNK